MAFEMVCFVNTELYPTYIRWVCPPPHWHLACKQIVEADVYVTFYAKLSYPQVLQIYTGTAEHKVDGA